jgi:hypothetical protein
MRSALVASIAMTLALGACGAGTPAPPPQDVVIWKPIGSWSGRGDAQTGVFTSDSGGFRVHWEIKNETRKDAGRLRVVLRSQDSGREIVEAIDARGAGSGVEDVAAERPRWYYLSIQSADADWIVSVDEPIDAQRTGARD